MTHWHRSCVNGSVNTHTIVQCETRTCHRICSSPLPTFAPCRYESWICCDSILPKGIKWAPSSTVAYSGRQRSCQLGLSTRSVHPGPMLAGQVNDIPADAQISLCRSSATYEAPVFVALRVPPAQATTKFHLTCPEIPCMHHCCMHRPVMMLNELKHASLFRPALQELPPDPNKEVDAGGCFAWAGRQ